MCAGPTYCNLYKASLTLIAHSLGLKAISSIYTRNTAISLYENEKLVMRNEPLSQVRNALRWRDLMREIGFNLKSKRVTKTFYWATNLSNQTRQAKHQGPEDCQTNSFFGRSLTNNLHSTCGVCYSPCDRGVWRTYSIAKSRWSQAVITFTDNL